MPSLLLDLPWLLPAPANYTSVVAKFSPEAHGLGSSLQRLTGYALPFLRLERLGQKIDRLQESGANLAPLKTLSLGIVSNATTDFLGNALRATAPRYGFDARLTIADFGQPMQEALDPSSPVNRARPDLILLALDHRALPMAVSPGQNSSELAKPALAYLRRVRDALARNSGARLMLQTIARPSEPLFGGFDRMVGGTWTNLIAEINAGIIALATETGDLVVDFASLAEEVGLSQWHDPGRWHDAKISFALDALPLAADHVLRVVAAWRGSARKVLVLDLDNTLWGGVIGDDGLDGIVLGQGDGVGEAFLELQRTAKQLSERGIVLAVCSKNTELIAREPFQKHPEMVLTERDISAFVANWNDKASNLRVIARTLELGLESFVFLDDNPAEREQVRQALPEVAVPELPDDPSAYAWLLRQAGYFESVAFTQEDRDRAGYYAANSERALAQAEHQSIDDYLRSLDMTISVAPIDAASLTRTVQLTNKTNQFNTTTRRVDEDEVRVWMHSPDHIILQARVGDRFGDYGIVGVVMANHRGNGDWTLPLWLMSCRVLNRKVEDEILNALVDRLRGRGAKRLMGEYIPTPKNGLVKDLYQKFGFSFVDGKAGENTRWLLELTNFARRETFFRHVDTSAKVAM